MKYLMFKNFSGDDAYAICIMEELPNITDEDIEIIVQQNVGDDFDGEELYGDWWIEEFTETKLSDLIGE